MFRDQYEPFLLIFKWIIANVYLSQSISFQLFMNEFINLAYAEL